jgi:tRNA-dihydrouridine synthase A
MVRLNSVKSNGWRVLVAPMMDWTDRHCRYFHRLLSKNALLYTEMVTTGALLYGSQPRHLDFNSEEHPVALQLGGSERSELAQCAKLGETWGRNGDIPGGYSEINLNCGCPSPRVQRGAFGACLMAEPALVADCVKAMVDAVDSTKTPITVKHRIGIDKTEDSPQSYAFVRDFVGTVSEAGCQTFIVHARNAWLKGLSPKANREVPPLRYEVVHQLKKDFPHLNIVINGGITTSAQISEELRRVDGVMVGREAYHNPWWLASWDADFFGDKLSANVDRPELASKPLLTLTREHVEAQMCDYMAREAVLHGTPWAAIARHMLGLRHGLPGSRRWRQVWSDHRLKSLPPHVVMALAHQPETRQEIDEAWNNLMHNSSPAEVMA